MASNSCPTPVWGVVDLYGMAVKVTILDRNDPNYCHVFINRPVERRSIFQQFPDMYDEETAEGRSYILFFYVGFIPQFMENGYSVLLTLMKYVKEM